MQDGELVRRITESRDHAALEALFTTYIHQIERHLTGIFKCCDADAKDAAQYAFVQLWEHGTRLTGESAMPLLCRYASNSLITEWRKKRHDKSLTPVDGERPLDVPDVRETAEPDFPKDVLDALPFALAKLDVKAQTVLDLRYRQDMTLEEIAAKIGQDQSTASRHISRGIEALRKFLHVAKPRPTNYAIHNRHTSAYHRRAHCMKYKSKKFYAACAALDSKLGEVSSAIKKPAASVGLHSEAQSAESEG
jgi:RNA polymerase sigma factor (sigma-70 family)